jgi:hypothetical protein
MLNLRHWHVLRSRCRLALVFKDKSWNAQVAVSHRRYYAARRTAKSFRLSTSNDEFETFISATGNREIEVGHKKYLFMREKATICKEMEWE